MSVVFSDALAGTTHRDHTGCQKADVRVRRIHKKVDRMHVRCREEASAKAPDRMEYCDDRSSLYGVRNRRFDEARCRIIPGRAGARTGGPCDLGRLATRRMDPRVSHRRGLEIALGERRGLKRWILR